MHLLSVIKGYNLIIIQPIMKKPEHVFEIIYFEYFWMFFIKQILKNSLYTNLIPSLLYCFHV